MAAAPSGTLIFRASGNYVGEIYRVDADGGNLVNLTATGNPSVGGTLSPDGGRIALTTDQHVVLIDSDGSDRVDLGPGTFVSWSPDGARILYGNFGESFGEWWIMNRDGSGVKLIVPRCAQCASPQWLDGQRLVAEIGGAAYDAVPSIVVIALDGRVLDSLPGTPGMYSELSLSPDASRILFVERPRSGPENIKIMNADGSGLRTLWSGGKYIGLSWSADSTRIAFAAQVVLNPGDPSPPPVDAELTVVDIATGASHVLDGAGAIYSMAWSPDGRTLAYAMSRDPVYRIRRVLIYTIPASGGAPTKVSDGPWYDMEPKWSADGKTITFKSDRSSRDGVYSFDAATGATTVLQPLPPGSLAADEQTSPTVGGGCVEPPKLPGEGFVIGCLSPNGRFRATVLAERLTITDVASGAVVSAEGLGAQQAPPAWSPDGTGVAFIGTSGSESWLYVFNPSTGDASRLVHADARANSTPSIIWARDGMSIFYTQGGFCTGGCTPGYMYRVAADGSGEQKLTDLRVLTLYGFAP